MASLFFSYSHIDEKLRNELEKHLTMLKRQGILSTWHDRRILAGGNLDSNISIELKRSDIVLVLISPDFLASNYCYDVEMKYALQRHNNGEARLIPVILRPCDWNDAPFGKLLALPRDGKPIVLWNNLDEAFNDVTQALKQLLGKHPLALTTTSPPTVTTTSSANTIFKLRSNSDLKVMCWEHNWTFYPSSKMRIVKKANVFRIINLTNIHNHAKIVFSERIEGDFTSEITLRGEYTDIQMQATNGNDTNFYINPSAFGLDILSYCTFLITRIDSVIKFQQKKISHLRQIPHGSFNARPGDADPRMDCFIVVAFGNSKTIDIRSAIIKE